MVHSTTSWKLVVLVFGPQFCILITFTIFILYFLVMKIIYKRHLPHIQPPGATIFITFRLEGSVPVAESRQVKEDYEHFTRIIQTQPAQRQIASRKRASLIFRYDSILHDSNNSPHYLKDSRIAKIVMKAIHFNDNQLYDLLAFCIMSNHVHVVLTPLAVASEEYISLERITHSIKSYTANQVNRLLNQPGQFWDHESFDHYCRSESEVNRFIDYTINNPVKAGLVNNPSEWPWSYRKR